MKKLLCVLLLLTLFPLPCRAVEVLQGDALSLSAPSAALLEQETGTLLYEKDAHTKRPIASVTKVMTLLLTMEAIESGRLHWDDPITASAHAAGMGGSQIWLEEGEEMTAEELIKCITVVSANDCSVAMAEHLAGSEEAFVAAMNEKAQELGMADTHFMNCTGLFDDPEHYSTAYDVALMARALMNHKDIQRFTTIWTDTARNGAFGLSNTNKLIRFYPGATGLKTGFTGGAMYCLAATAEREGTAYVAAVLGDDTSAGRFESARTLLNHGFARYLVADFTEGISLPPVPVVLGRETYVLPVCQGSPKFLLEKGQKQALCYVPELPKSIEAPVTESTPLGSVTVYAGEEVLARFPLHADRNSSRLGTLDIFHKLLEILLCKSGI